MLTLLLTCTLLIILPLLYDHYHRCLPITASRSISPNTAPTPRDPTSTFDRRDEEVPNFAPDRREVGNREGGMNRYDTGSATGTGGQNSHGAGTTRMQNPAPRGTAEKESPWISYPSHSRIGVPRTLPSSSLATQLSPEERTSYRPSVLRGLVFVMAVMLFIFAFAVLIAHCLAGFIVYKTEARLGELHRGVLRGGDMRVCLCAP